MNPSVTTLVPHRATHPGATNRKPRPRNHDPRHAIHDLRIKNDQLHQGPDETTSVPSSPREGRPNPRRPILHRTLARVLHERHRLHPCNIETFSAPDILAGHNIIPPHHIAPRLRKARLFFLIRIPCKPCPLAPHQPRQGIIRLLKAVRTSQRVRLHLGPLVEEVPFVMAAATALLPPLAAATSAVGSPTTSILIPGTPHHPSPLPAAADFLPA